MTGKPLDGNGNPDGDGKTDAGSGGTGTDNDQGGGKTDAGTDGKTESTKGIDGDRVDLAKLQEILDDRNNKGRQNAELKGKLKELESQLKSLKPLADAEEKRRQDEMSELEKTNEQLAKTQEKLVAAQSRVVEQERRLIASEAGVKPEYLAVINTMVTEAERTDENLDVAEFVKGLKTTHGALFGQVQTSETAGGPAAQSDDQASRDAQIEALEKQLKETGPFLTRQQRVELIGKIESMRHAPTKGGTQ